jgi:hypothetical protein
LRPARRPSNEENLRVSSGKNPRGNASETHGEADPNHRTEDVEPASRIRRPSREKEPLQKLSDLATFNQANNRPVSADRDERSLSPFKKLSASKANAQKERYPLN